MDEAREKVYHVRLNEAEAAIVEELRKTYGFRYTADLFRYAIDHVNRTRPTLARRFKPQSEDERGDTE